MNAWLSPILPPTTQTGEDEMKFKFVVEVEIERESGLIASRELGVKTTAISRFDTTA